VILGLNLHRSQSAPLLKASRLVSEAVWGVGLTHRPAVRVLQVISGVSAKIIVSITGL